MLATWPQTTAMLLTIAMAASALFLDDYYSDTKIDDERLPVNVKPNEYYLRLHPFIDKGFFNGSVLINISCEEPTNIITLHAHESLDITDIQIFEIDNENFTESAIENSFRNSSAETLTLVLNNELRCSNIYLIYIEFTGKLNDLESNVYSHELRKYKGFYRVNYKHSNAQESSWCAATYMSAKYARRVFPCFDEPSFKASFTISVARPTEMSTMSVMPLESSEVAEEEGWMWDHFPPTPLLSTFSINLVVCNFTLATSLNISTKYSNIMVNFYHTQNYYVKIRQDDIKLIPHMIGYLENLFEVPYPLPKLDIVTLPSHFSFYMPQNALGLLMHDEQMIQYGSLILVPDLVDQWIGHMVTPEWWNDVNITNVISFYLIRTGLMKTFNKNYWFILQSSDLYERFSKPNFHPHFKGGLFDIYCTMRGVRFLEMLNYTLSEETFNSGLKNFVTNNLYSTFNEHSFWTCMNNQALNDSALPESLTVEVLANSWLNGTQHFPVLSAERNYEENTALLEQHMFIREEHYNFTEKDKNQLWWIPITYVTPENLKHPVYPVAWMDGKYSNISDLPSSDKFIIVNPTDSGMFLVNYDRNNWQLISQYLLEKEPKLPSEVRGKVLQDALFLAAAGELDYVTALNMTLFLFNETDYLVWIPFVNIFLKDIEKHYQWTSVEDKFNLYVRNLLTPVFKNLHRPHYFDYDNVEYTSFWYSARDILERVGYQPHINETHKELNKIMSTFAMEDNDTQLIIFCPEFMRNSSENWTEHIDKLEIYMNRINHILKHFWKKSIAKCPGYVELIQRILNETLEEGKVFRSSNWKALVHLITSSPVAHNMTFNFFLEHYDEYKQRFYYIKDIWTDFLSALISKVKTEEGLQKLSQFYEEYEHKLGYSRTTVKNSLKEVTEAVSWLKDHMPDIEYWFDYVLPQFN